MTEQRCKIDSKHCRIDLKRWICNRIHRDLYSECSFINYFPTHCTFSFIFLNLSLSVNSSLLNYHWIQWWHNGCIRWNSNCGSFVFFSDVRNHFQRIGFHLFVVFWYDLMFIQVGNCIFVGTKFFPFLDDEVVSVIDESFRNIQVNQPTFENWLILGRQIAYGRRSSCGWLSFSNNRNFTNLRCSFSQMQSQGWIRNPRTLLKKPLLILTHCDPLAFRLFPEWFSTV